MLLVHRTNSHLPYHSPDIASVSTSTRSFSAEKQSYEAVRPEVPVYRFFCNSIDEERRNKKIDVEEEEASSESDGQYDTDLEEDFPSKHPRVAIA